MDQREHAPFNREIAKSLFANCKEISIGQIVLKDFVEQYIKGVVKIQSKIEQIHNELAELNKEMRTLSDELTIARYKDETKHQSSLQT